MFLSYEERHRQQPNATLLKPVLQENHILGHRYVPTKDFTLPMNLIICSKLYTFLFVISAFSIKSVL